MHTFESFSVRVLPRVRVWKSRSSRGIQLIECFDKVGIQTFASPKNKFQSTFRVWMEL